MFEDRFINQFFSLFFGREMKKKKKIRWGIPKYCSKWAIARGNNTDYGGFMCYLLVLLNKKNGDFQKIHCIALCRVIK